MGFCLPRSAACCRARHSCFLFMPHASLDWVLAFHAQPQERAAPFTFCRNMAFCAAMFLSRCRSVPALPEHRCYRYVHSFLLRPHLYPARHAWLRWFMPVRYYMLVVYVHHRCCCVMPLRLRRLTRSCAATVPSLSFSMVPGRTSSDGDGYCCWFFPTLHCCAPRFSFYFGLGICGCLRYWWRSRRMLSGWTWFMVRACTGFLPFFVCHLALLPRDIPPCWHVPLRFCCSRHTVCRFVACRLLLRVFILPPRFMPAYRCLVAAKPLTERTGPSATAC